MAGELEVFLGISAGVNLLLIMVFTRLHGVWAQPGIPNFFMQQIKYAFNRIKNGKLVIGTNFSKFVPLYFVGDNEPVYPDPSDKTGLPLQYDPKNVYHGPRGMQVIFANAGGLSNVDPLKDANDDVELSLVAQTTEKFIQLEVERRYSKDNPFNKITRLFLLHGVVMVVGFLILGVILLNIQGVAEGIGQVVTKYQPVVENILAHPEQFGITTNPIGANPNTPPSSSIIPGVI